jgi:hypothetical protein
MWVNIKGPLIFFVLPILIEGYCFQEKNAGFLEKNKKIIE